MNPWTYMTLMSALTAVTNTAGHGLGGAIQVLLATVTQVIATVHIVNKGWRE